MSERPSIPPALRRHPLTWIAIGFGSGLAPKAPGTAGSVLALLPVVWLSQLSAVYYIAFLVGAFALGIWASHHVVTNLKTQDHQSIVWDEMVGVWIAVFGLSAVTLVDWGWLLLGLGLFRAFDIAKPWPISIVDRDIHGGLGVMLDDVLAGIAALGTLTLIRMLVDII